EFLQDLVLKGVQEAIQTGKEKAAAEMKKLTGGLGIPGL
ncbi:MAG: YbaB/EbfC family nucleoid-associated protein, partial [Luteolibacter sp.]